MSEDERVFRESFLHSDGKVTYGPDHVIDDGPFAGPGFNGSYVELGDGWYRLKPKEVSHEKAEEAHP